MQIFLPYRLAICQFFLFTSLKPDPFRYYKKIRHYKKIKCPDEKPDYLRHDEIKYRHNKIKYRHNKKAKRDFQQCAEMPLILALRL